MAECFSDLLASPVKANFGGANILSSQNDMSKINWAKGLSDPGEMFRCGYLPIERGTRCCLFVVFLSAEFPALVAGTVPGLQPVRCQRNLGRRRIYMSGPWRCRTPPGRHKTQLQIVSSGTSSIEKHATSLLVPTKGK